MYFLEIKLAEGQHRKFLDYKDFLKFFVISDEYGIEDIMERNPYGTVIPFANTRFKGVLHDEKIRLRKLLTTDEIKLLINIR